MVNTLGQTQVIAQIPFNSAIQLKGLAGEELDVTMSELENITNFVIKKSKEEK
jgi:hypothetical protein